MRKYFFLNSTQAYSGCNIIHVLGLGGIKLQHQVQRRLQKYHGGSACNNKIINKKAQQL